MDTQVYIPKTWEKYQTELHSVQRFTRSSWSIKSGTIWEGKTTEEGKVNRILEVRVWTKIKKKIRDKRLSTQ